MSTLDRVRQESDRVSMLIYGYRGEWFDWRQGAQREYILWSDSDNNVTIYSYHHRSLDGKRVKAYLDHLWPVIVPEKAGVEQEVLEVVRVPACILPIKDGQVEGAFIIWNLWAYSFDHNVLLLYIPLRKSGMVVREGCRKMFSEPFDLRHVLVIVSTYLTELLYQAKAKLLFNYEGTIDLLSRFRVQKRRYGSGPRSTTS
jgi:hypothetical protein